MTTDEAKELLGLGDAKSLAELLGITEQAVSQWGQIVPELRAYQIKAIVAERQAA